MPSKRRGERKVIRVFLLIERFFGCWLKVDVSRGRAKSFVAAPRRMSGYLLSAVAAAVTKRMRSRRSTAQPHGNTRALSPVSVFPLSSRPRPEPRPSFLHVFLFADSGSLPFVIVGPAAFGAFSPTIFTEPKWHGECSRPSRPGAGSDVCRPQTGR